MYVLKASKEIEDVLAEGYENVDDTLNLIFLIFCPFFVRPGRCRQETSELPTVI